MPRVLIPPPYRGPTRGEAEVRVAGATVRACLDAVDAHYPGFRDLVYDTDGEPYPYVQIFLNGVLLEAHALDSRVAVEDEIGILAAIAGG